MTQFKVGDRVKLVKEFGGWCNSNVGKEGVIITKDREDYDWERVKFYNSSGDMFETDYGNPSHLELVSTTPPETIQHEGYNYTRGEPVVPEWVKDGAWVVHKESGDLHQLFEDGPGYFKAVNKKTRHPFVLDFHPSMPVSDVFRPFTDADWKWGMWAEYKGEKVFVSAALPTGLAVSKPTDGYFLAPFSEITPTTAP